MKIKEMESAIEAILFVSGESVDAGTLAKALECQPSEAQAAVRGLMDRYVEEKRGIRIVELDGAYQMCTAPEMYGYLARVAKQPKKAVLTEVVLETLSIIAYKQPVTKMELEKIRGVKCDHAVNKLIEFQLVQELGRLDAPGRPLLFGTTEEFLRCFGVRSLRDLPPVNPVQLEDFKQEAEEEVPLAF